MLEFGDLGVRLVELVLGRGELVVLLGQLIVLLGQLRVLLLDYCVSLVQFAVLTRELPLDPLVLGLHGLPFLFALDLEPL